MNRMLADLLIATFPALPPRVGSWYSDSFWDHVSSIEIVPGQASLLTTSYNFTHLGLFEVDRVRADHMIFLPWKHDRGVTRGFEPHENGQIVLQQFMWGERYYGFEYAVEMTRQEPQDTPMFAMKIHWFGQFDFEQHFGQLIDGQTEYLKSVAELGMQDLMSRMDDAANQLKTRLKLPSSNP